MKHSNPTSKFWHFGISKAFHNYYFTNVETIQILISFHSEKIQKPKHFKKRANYLGKKIIFENFKLINIYKKNKDKYDHIGTFQYKFQI